MVRLRNDSTIVESALKSRGEGMGVRATGRVYGKSHATILRWEERLAGQSAAWSPPAPADSEAHPRRR